MKNAAFIIILLFLAQGCAAPPDQFELNWPVNEPLVNGELVTIEVIHVNASKTPGRSLDKAIEGFSKYVAGKVRTIQGKPIELEVDSDGLLTQAQLGPAIANRRYSGASDITIIVIPGLSDFPGRGFCLREPDGSHTVVIQAERLRKRVPPLISRQKWAHLVIKHELCHALGVPTDRSHAWSNHHCTRPECILYPRADSRAIMVAALRFATPPMDLCGVCQKEVRKAQLQAGGNLVSPAQIQDQGEYLNTLLEMNLDNPGAIVLLAARYYVGKDFENAAMILKKYLSLNPDDYRTLNFLALILSTCSDDDVRDGPRAVELATKACELSEWKNRECVEILAAAYAQAGQFDRAIEFQEKVIALVGDAPTESYRKRLDLYRANTPYVEHRPQTLTIRRKKK